MSEVLKFYTGQCVLVTGGTGFLGKVLTEKLIRGCPKIGTIYLLIRTNRGKSAEERVAKLLNDSIFDGVRSDYPKFSEKIIGIDGDISQENLGLSMTDYQCIVDEVSVIFHLAATVRFNEKLDKAIATNVNSVKYIIDVAKACRKLKSTVYVSTAFSNCTRKCIEEKLYQPPLSYELANDLVGNGKRENYSEKVMEEITKSILGEWPNTYTFTKAIAEGVVNEFAKDLPFAVFRPSIVISAYQEPVPGWLCGPEGYFGLLCASGVGIMKVCFLDGKMKADFVPVDYFCNALISSAWETAVTERRQQDDIPVYNYVSSNANPILWGKLLFIFNALGHVYPTTKTIYYPTSLITSSERLYITLSTIFQTFPALMIDGIAALIGKQRIAYKVSRKLRAAQLALGYFGTQQWDFEDRGIQNLWERIDYRDKKLFPFNLEDVDWDVHTLYLIRGLRKYIMSDSEENLAEARQRQSYLYVIHVIVCLTFALGLLWIMWKLFLGLGL